MMGNGPPLYDRRGKIKEGQWTGWQLYAHLEQELRDQDCKVGETSSDFQVKARGQWGTCVLRSIEF